MQVIFVGESLTFSHCFSDRDGNLGEQKKLFWVSRYFSPEGDRLLEVDGISFRGFSYHQAVDCLSKTGEVNTCL